MMWTEGGAADWPQLGGYPEVGGKSAQAMDEWPEHRPASVAFPPGRIGLLSYLDQYDNRNTDPYDLWRSDGMYAADFGLPQAPTVAPLMPWIQTPDEREAAMQARKTEEDQHYGSGASAWLMRQGDRANEAVRYYAGPHLYDALGRFQEALRGITPVQSQYDSARTLVEQGPDAARRALNAYWRGDPWGVVPPALEMLLAAGGMAPGAPKARPGIAQGPKRYRLVGNREFVQLEDGSLDLGHISPSIAEETKIDSGYVRLPKGDGRFGEVHMERSDRAAQVRAAGFRDAADFVSYVARDFDEIWQGRDGTLMLVKRDDSGKANTLYIELAPTAGGEVYEVLSGGPFRGKYPEGSGRTRVWTK